MPYHRARRSYGFYQSFEYVIEPEVELDMKRKRRKMGEIYNNDNNDKSDKSDKTNVEYLQHEINTEDKFKKEERTNEEVSEFNEYCRTNETNHEGNLDDSENNVEVKITVNDGLLYDKDKYQSSTNLLVDVGEVVSIDRIHAEENDLYPVIQTGISMTTNVLSSTNLIPTQSLIESELPIATGHDLQIGDQTCITNQENNIDQSFYDDFSDLFGMQNKEHKEMIQISEVLNESECGTQSEQAIHCSSYPSSYLPFYPTTGIPCSPDIPPTLHHSPIDGPTLPPPDIPLHASSQETSSPSEFFFIEDSSDIHSRPSESPSKVWNPEPCVTNVPIAGTIQPFPVIPDSGQSNKLFESTVKSPLHKLRTVHLITISISLLDSLRALVSWTVDIRQLLLELIHLGRRQCDDDGKSKVIKKYKDKTQPRKIQYNCKGLNISLGQMPMFVALIFESSNNYERCWISPPVNFVTFNSTPAHCTQIIDLSQITVRFIHPSNVYIFMLNFPLFRNFR